MLRWGDLDAARTALDELRSPPYWELAPARRLTNATQTPLDSVAAWMSGEIPTDDDSPTASPCPRPADDEPEHALPAHVTRGYCLHTRAQTPIRPV